GLHGQAGHGLEPLTMSRSTRTAAQSDLPCASGAGIRVGTHLQRVEPGPLHLRLDPVPDDPVEHAKEAVRDREDEYQICEDAHALRTELRDVPEEEPAHRALDSIPAGTVGA